MAHGWWCNTITYPTTCRGCGEPVFFFRCDCGSAVFFDALGEPWPEHDCETSWTRNLTRWTDDSGAINVQLLPGVTVRRPPSGTIDADVAKRGQRRQAKHDPIRRVDPDGTNVEATAVGILREKQQLVDVADALKLPAATAMASAFLGPLGKGRWGKVTVHAPSPRDDVLHSYTAWVPTDVLAQLGRGIGTTVSVGLYSVSVPRTGTFWVCREFEAIG